MGKDYLTKNLRELGVCWIKRREKFRFYCRSFTLYSIFLFDLHPEKECLQSGGKKLYTERGQIIEAVFATGSSILHNL